MGLPAPIAEFLFTEAQNDAHFGDVGFIGRQTVYLYPPELYALGKKHGFYPPEGFAIELDTQTQLRDSLGGGAKISDRCLMRYLGAKTFTAIDVSNYEGADTICDMSREVPAELRSRFDFVFDGSCLDNIFSPATAVANASRILRPGGRMMLFNHGSWTHGTYSICSPGWYFDYFVVNRYADCRIYLASFRDNLSLHLGPMKLWRFNWREAKDGNTPPIGQHFMVIVLAKKGVNSTNDVLPVQRQYRVNNAGFDAVAGSFESAIGQGSPVLIRCRTLGTSSWRPKAGAILGVLRKKLLHL